MRWGIFAVLLTFSFSLHVITAQILFETNVRDGRNGTTKIPGIESGFEFGRKLPGFGSNPNEEDEEYSDEDEDDLNVNLEFRVGPKEKDQNPGRGEGRGRGNGNGRGRGNGNGNGNGKNKEKGRGREGGNNGGGGGGRGRQNPGRGKGKKKGQNPCGPRGQFCPRRSYIEDMGLHWSKRVQNGTGFFVRGPNGERQYNPIGYQEPNENYGDCKTPNGDSGECRHLEHCILEEFRSDFVRFLEYTCPIPYGDYVGVCCPEDDDADEGGRGFFPFPLPIPTNRPTQRPPSRRPTTKPTSRFTPPATATTRTPKPRPRYPCGYSEQKTSRIVGGRIADPKAWHWMAALIRSIPDAGDVRAGQFCGGVLISEFHVLTAAHCVDAFPANDIKVRLGEYDFSQKEGTSRADFDVASVKIHEKFNKYSYQNDIAIIRLATSAFVNTQISPICLPPPNDDEKYVNDVGIVTGWGTIYYGGPTSNTLMEVSVPIWKQEDCQAAYTQPIEETNLCAGVRSGSRDSCQGDSGGPLQLLGKDRLWRVVGVVSWGIRCSEPGYPGVYTRISKYIDWIQTHL